MILERIRSALPEMTPLNRKIASYILDHGQSVGLSSIYAMSETIGVSNASLIRFARSIGMKGFSDLKRALQDEIKQAISPYEKIASSGLGALPRDERMRKLFQNESDNLRKTLDRLDYDALERVAEGVCGARRVIVSGFGASRYLAGILEYSLLGTLDNEVRAISGSVSDFTPALKSLGREDVVAHITFPPYSREGLQVAREARERGARFYLFTDSASCPLYAGADEVIACANNSLLLSNSFVGIVAVLQVLQNMVCLRDKKASMKNRSEVMEMERRGYEAVMPPEEGR